MKQLIFLMIAILIASCSNNEVLDNALEQAERGKPTKCDAYVAPPTDVYTTLWPTQEEVSVRELIVYTIDRSGAAWRWDGDKARKKWSLHLSRLACHNIEINGYFDFRSFIYRIAIIDSNGNVVNEGCFTPICDVTSYQVDNLIEGETYTVKYVDFPEANTKTFIKETY